MKEQPDYGAGRNRAASVSFAEIEAAALQLMKDGGYASVAAIRKALGRGSTTTIAEAMRRFWKNQAALNTGDPIALTRLPAELAEAALALWERALLLSQQTAKHEDNAARAQLQTLQSDVEHRVRSIELREKEWDLAARIRERALADAREHVNLLMTELSAAREESRARETHVTELAAQLDQLRQQLATVIARAVARHRSPPQAVKTPTRAAGTRRRAVVVHPRRRPGRKVRAGRMKRRIHPLTVKSKRSQALGRAAMRIGRRR